MQQDNVGWKKTDDETLSGIADKALSLSEWRAAMAIRAMVRGSMLYSIYQAEWRAAVVEW